MWQKFITKCVRFFIINCDSYYEMQCLLQIATVQFELTIHFIKVIYDDDMWVDHSDITVSARK